MRSILHVLGVLLFVIGMMDQSAMAAVNFCSDKYEVEIRKGMGGTFLERVVPGNGSEITDAFQVALTFSGNVTVKTGMLNFGMGDVVNLDMASDVVVNGGQVVVNLTAYKNKMAGCGGFALVLQVADETGNFLTYGDVADYVMLQYTVPLIRNTFEYLSVNPGSGDVSSLKEVTLTYMIPEKRQGAAVGALDSKMKAIVYEANNPNTVLATGTLEEVLGADQFSYVGVKVVLDKEITTAGDYVLDIPEQTIYNDMADSSAPDFGIGNDVYGEIRYNSNIRLNYTIRPSVTLIESVPVIGGELNMFTQYKVELTFSENVIVESATLKMGVNGMEEVAANCFSVVGNKVVINLKKYYQQMSDAGVFSLILKVKDSYGNYATYGDVPDSVFLKYTMPRDTFYYLYSEPENLSQVSSLKEIVLYYMDIEKKLGGAIGAIANDAQATLCILNVEEPVAYGVFSLVEDLVSGAYTGLKVTLEKEITTPGDYTLAIIDRVVYNDAADPTLSDFGVSVDTEHFIRYNPIIFLDFTILGDNPDGIEHVEVQGERDISVYSIQGIFLRKGVVSTVLEGLEKGLYIVNGKKMAVF